MSCISYNLNLLIQIRNSYRILHDYRVHDSIFLKLGFTVFFGVWTQTVDLWWTGLADLQSNSDDTYINTLHNEARPRWPQRARGAVVTRSC